MEWIAIPITALVASLILLVEHYAPIKAKHPTLNYILGVLALILPFSGLMMVWQLWLAIAAIWAICGAGGATVLAAYWIDHTLELRKRVKAAELEAQMLRPEVNVYAANERPIN